MCIYLSLIILSSIEWLRRCSSSFSVRTDLLFAIVDGIWKNRLKTITVCLFSIMVLYYSANAVLVSTEISTLTSMVKLISFMLNFNIQSVDCSSQPKFLQDLRTAVRMAACDSKHVVIMLKVIIKRLKVVSATFLLVCFVSLRERETALLKQRKMFFISLRKLFSLLR